MRVSNKKKEREREMKKKRLSSSSSFSWVQVYTRKTDVASHWISLLRVLSITPINNRSNVRRLNFFSFFFFSSHWFHFRFSLIFFLLHLLMPLLFISHFQCDSSLGRLSPVKESSEVKEESKLNHESKVFVCVSPLIQSYMKEREKEKKERKRGCRQSWNGVAYPVASFNSKCASHTFNFSFSLLFHSRLMNGKESREREKNRMRKEREESGAEKTSTSESKFTLIQWLHFRHTSWSLHVCMSVIQLLSSSSTSLSLSLSHSVSFFLLFNCMCVCVCPHSPISSSVFQFILSLSLSAPSTIVWVCKFFLFATFISLCLSLSLWLPLSHSHPFSVQL